MEVLGGMNNWCNVWSSLTEGTRMDRISNDDVNNRTGVLWELVDRWICKFWAGINKRKEWMKVGGWRWRCMQMRVWGDNGWVVNLWGIVGLMEWRRRRLPWAENDCHCMIMTWTGRASLLLVVSFRRDGQQRRKGPAFTLWWGKPLKTVAHSWPGVSVRSPCRTLNDMGKNGWFVMRVAALHIGRGGRMSIDKFIF